MGGEVGLASDGASGSKFWLTLPIAKQPGVRAQAPEAWLQGHAVLIADPGAAQRQALRTRLEAWKASVELAPDGPAALEALDRALAAGRPFELALIDPRLAGPGGRSLIEALVADPRHRGTRLVLLSSPGHPTEPRGPLAAGVAAVVPKPARQGELLDALLGRAPGASAVRRVAREPGEPLFPGFQPRLLLAEDNLVNQRVALGLLRKLGLGADVVANGAEAVRALASAPYDLVLMDVQMPELDGLQATRAIRDPGSAVRDHRVPVIAMTANAMQGDRQACLAAGMSDYLSKPIDVAALAAVLRAWVPRA
jgi:CheY-like chemotaxis protein